MKKHIILPVILIIACVLLVIFDALVTSDITATGFWLRTTTAGLIILSQALKIYTLKTQAKK